MKICLVKMLKGGERLAEPVITENKEILIAGGTVLKPEYLDLIAFLGIDHVCIEDPYKAEEKYHPIINEKKIQEYKNRVQKILENHIYQEKGSLDKIRPLADNIVADVLCADTLTVVDMKERIPNLYEHTVMVTLLSVMVAIKLNVKKEYLTRIAIGCLLHDLGLRYITVQYANYNLEKLSPSEVFEYKKHSILAYSALEQEMWIGSVSKKMILTHHERRDGSGFPLRHKSRELECNILQACDAFDSCISGIEGKRIGIQQTLEYFAETADVLFERKIVKVIEKIVARYPVGTKVRLNSGEYGIVVCQTSNAIRPVIGVLDEDEKMTDVRYNLEKKKEIVILQVED